MIKNILGTLTYQIQQTGAEVRLGELPSCVGDQTQINQVFTNLIDNAIKYHHPDRKSVISIEGRESDGKVTFSVTDNGIGIASAYVDKIFEIFHRLSPSLTQGEGLGLTIAQRIVKRHNGTISVESQPGEGTSFTVILPAGDEPTSP
jgi:signal transduction histidine kinase